MSITSVITWGVIRVSDPQSLVAKPPPLYGMKGGQTSPRRGVDQDRQSGDAYRVRMGSAERTRQSDGGESS